MFNSLEKEKKLNLIMCFVLFFLLICTIYFISLVFSNPIAVVNLKIKNLEAVLPNISQEDKKLLTYQLTDMIAKNTPLSSKITNNEIYIDINSLKEEKYSNYVLRTFIINVDDLSQKYEVQYYDGKGYDDYKINVSCVSSCLATESSTDFLTSALPHSETTSNIYWTINKDEYFSPKNISILLSIDYCGNNLDTLEIETRVNDYLKQYNVEEFSLSKQFSCYIQD